MIFWPFNCLPFPGAGCLSPWRIFCFKLFFRQWWKTFFSPPRFKNTKKKWRKSLETSLITDSFFLLRLSRLLSKLLRIIYCWDRLDTSSWNIWTSNIVLLLTGNWKTKIICSAHLNQLKWRGKHFRTIGSRNSYLEKGFH